MLIMLLIRTKVMRLMMKLNFLMVSLLCTTTSQLALAQTEPLDMCDTNSLLQQLEKVLESGDKSSYLSLLTPVADRSQARAFVDEHVKPGVVRAVARERLRTQMPDVPQGEGYELVVEVFTEMSSRGYVATWQLHVRRNETKSLVSETIDECQWQIENQTIVDMVEDLYRLSLNPAKQYDARNLIVLSDDLRLTLVEGSVFVAETDRGITGLVLIGNGDMMFSPTPVAERGQVKIFSGAETLETPFTELFIRLHPDSLGKHLSAAKLIERPVNKSELSKAEKVFNAFVAKSFSLDLGDLSDETWSLSPGPEDFLAEIKTRRFNTLTYAQSANKPEDITVYDREAQLLIALYPSQQKIAAHGQYYSDPVPYDILDYHIESSFRSLRPARISQESADPRSRLTSSNVEGRARLSLRITAFQLTRLTLKIADSLQVHSVTSRLFGPLLHFRLIGQNAIIINLPSQVPFGTEFTLILAYSGLLYTEDLDENWIGRTFLAYEDQMPFRGGEPRYLYSNRSYWYPQSTATDYATATLELVVPDEFVVVATGDTSPGSPTMLEEDTDTLMRKYSFVTLQPARYLACVITRFAPDGPSSRQISLNDAIDKQGGEPGRLQPGVFYKSLALRVEASRRSRHRVSDLTERAVDILSFYTSLVRDFPYPNLTLTLTDSQLPGGHSPAYFTVLSHPLQVQAGVFQTWRNDPVSFSSYPSFFLAHELAHQWWGQAVGWKNYHEQWLSEGLSQYFAALYAQREGGADLFADVMEEMQDWAMRHSEEGPVYLGYRLGHIENEPTVYRALVYNKAAMVLHMLRRLIGDEKFFAGLSRFYEAWRFKKAGTNDLQHAFEAETQTSLERFFRRWIHQADLPRLKFSHHVERNTSESEATTTMSVRLRFEQEGDVFDIPVTVSLNYRSGESKDVIVQVTEAVTEVRVPLAGELRKVEVNRDHFALAHISR